MDFWKEKVKRQRSVSAFNFNRLYNFFIRKNKLRAYLTVEASMLFPIILGMIILLIYILFFLHGRAIISANAYGGAISACSCNQEDLLKKINEYNGFNSSKTMSVGYFYGAASMKEHNNLLVSKIKAKSYNYVPFLSSDKFFRINEKGTAVKKNAVDIIRKTRLTLDMIKIIKNESGKE